MTYLFIEDLLGWGAIIILGTGAGIAFFMLMAHRRASADFIACTAAMVCGRAVHACGADRRANHRGYPDEDVFDGDPRTLACGRACALRHRRPALGTGDVHADRDARSGRRRCRMATPLPPRYFALFCRWVHCGIFGFSSTMIVPGLMIATDLGGMISKRGASFPDKIMPKRHKRTSQ